MLLLPSPAPSIPPLTPGGLNHQDVSTICRPKPEARIRGGKSLRLDQAKKVLGRGIKLLVEAVLYETMKQKARLPKIKSVKLY